MKKDSFILYAYQAETIADLSLEQKGSLLNALFEYAAGETPNISDQAVKVAFAFIRMQIERDHDKYNEVCEKRRAAVSKRYKKLQDDTKTYKKVQNTTKSNKTTQDDTNDRDNDNEYDNDSSSPVGDDEMRACAKSSPSALEDYFDELKNKAPLWRETMRIKHKIKEEQLTSWLDKFVLHCRSRDVTHDNLRDVKRHFDDWLRINLTDIREKADKNASRKANNNLTSNPNNFQFEHF